MELIREKKCENCRYFSQHYAKKNMSYYTVYCGQCLNQKLTLKEMKKKTPDCAACELWEPIEIRKAERKTSIKNTLLSMARRVEEMYVLLKEDEEATKSK